MCSLFVHCNHNGWDTELSSDFDNSNHTISVDVCLFCTIFESKIAQGDLVLVES